MNKKGNLTYGKIAIYMVVFFLVWSVRELVIRPVFLNQLDGIMFQVVESAIKIVIWTVPAVLLIKHFKADMLISLKEMFTNQPPWLMAFGYIALAGAIPLVNGLLMGDGLQIRADFDPVRLIGAVLIVGITEELIFRGFLLNGLLKKMKMEFAIAIDAVLFTLIHYPVWIYRGFDLTTILTSSISVAILSVLFAHSFIKTKSIWVPIIMHMIYNLLLAMFGTCQLCTLY